jgi:hypothetical protein
VCGWVALSEDEGEAVNVKSSQLYFKYPLEANGKIKQITRIITKNYEQILTSDVPPNRVMSHQTEK